MLPVHKSLEPFVKDIVLLESDDKDREHVFPFYADGYAGVVYSKSENPFYLQPRNKQLSDFYLYGQTIEPISLNVKGPFKSIILRMYPFASRILLGIDPKILNDDCYDLLLLDNIDTLGTVKRLRQTENKQELVNILANYFNELLKVASINPDYRIKLATNLILKSNGAISIKEVRDKLCVAERTLERHFLKEIGVTAKQFAKMIQFSTSLNQITDADYLNLTEIGFDSGFADQSHFIRTFKRYTGKTPKEFQAQVSF
ncbi:MAG: AraC family transcriptional regulator [Flavobacteriales bacterium]|nr:AraC family transcriptional regulator [Flavobacteriales bacterium]